MVDKLSDKQIYEYLKGVNEQVWSNGIWNTNIRKKKKEENLEIYIIIV